MRTYSSNNIKSCRSTHSNAMSDNVTKYSFEYCYQNTRIILSTFETMKKGTLLVLLLIVSVIGGSHQRPLQHAEDVPALTTTATATSTAAAAAEETTKEFTKAAAAATAAAATAAAATAVDKTSQVTEATAAVSVRTIVNVTSSSSSSSSSSPPPHYVPGDVFEDFEPSNYYGPGGEPKFERPSQQVVRAEAFRQPEYFWRPDDRTHRNAPPSKPDGTRDVVFPSPTPTAASQRHKHFERHRLDGQTDESSHRSPHVWSAEVSLRSKPAKHDSGGVLPPDFGGAFHGGGGDFYERLNHFGVAGQHPGHDTPPYPHRPADVVRAPPKSYHGIVTAHHKKKDPWRSMLSVLATILPVGLLLASFPPTVIKVNSTQYPYQFQKNSTTYYPNVVVGRYKMLENNNGRRKVNEQNELSGYLDDCLKKKICENIKNNYSSSEFSSLLQNHKLNLADNRGGSMVEIAEAAVSTAPESCRVFVCGN